MFLTHHFDTDEHQDYRSDNGSVASLHVLEVDLT